jgi:hypothetical protein
MAYTQDNAASVRGVALRVTRLGSNGAPVTGTACDTYLTSGFIKATFTPVYSDGDEVEQKNAAGSVCVYYKMPDTLKNITLGLELCDPDPVLTQLLVGGDILTVAGGEGDPDEAVGYAGAVVGQEQTPYGVAVEVWAQAVVGGKAANHLPYWHYVFPYAKFKLDGDRVVENGTLATVFAGTGGGNEGFEAGPALDFTGVDPLPEPDAFQWEFPAVTNRPYAYARTGSAPVGLSGVFDNLGIAITAVTPGAPAVLTPADASLPANLSALIALGDLDQSTDWTVGQYILLADGSHAFWSGETWAEGNAPVTVVDATTATAGTPGTFSPSGATVPGNLALMEDITASPTTLWTIGQYVELGDSTRAYYTGTVWHAGTSPGGA